MNKKKDGFEKAYEEAFSLACKALLKKDVIACCKNGGGGFVRRSENELYIKIIFLNKFVTITIPEFNFSTDRPDSIHIWEKILILHYLINADETSLTGNLINYRQVKDGANYFPTFEKRSIKPIISFFGEKPDLLISASKILGGEEVKRGDVGVKITALPFVPVFFVLWKADEEFPPEGGILFDSSIEKKLSAEDIAVLCQQIVFKIIKS